MKEATKQKIKGFIVLAAVVLAVVGFSVGVFKDFIKSEQPKFQAQKVFSKYESAKTEEDKFAATELRRCMADGSNNADCRIKIAVLAGQIKGDSFKVKVAESLAKITTELDKKD